MSEVYIHPSAVVDPGALLGAGTKVWHFVHVSGRARIGRNVVLGQGVYVGNRVQIGDRCKIQNNVSVFENVTLESEVFCGPSMVFTNVVNPRAHVERKNEFQKTIVRRGASIGANATVLCGVTIGAYSFVAAGAVVLHDVKPYALVAGVPARQIGWMSKYGARIPLELSGDGAFSCPHSGEEYVMKNGDLEAI